jgi:Tfp pilus assembly protein PilZ
MNNRISPRKILQTRVIFEDEFNEEFLYFTSTNISVSGIFIQTKLPFKASTKVFLKFSLYEGDAPVQVAGEVTRFMDKKRGPGRRKPITTGVGLKFLGLSDADFLKVKKYVESH